MLRRYQRESAEESRAGNAWKNAAIDTYVDKLQQPADGNNKHSHQQQGSVHKRTRKQIADEASILNLIDDFSEICQSEGKANRMEQIKEAQKLWASDSANPDFTDADVPTGGEAMASEEQSPPEKKSPGKKGKPGKETNKYKSGMTSHASYHGNNTVDVHLVENIPEHMLKVYTDGSSHHNGKQGAVAGSGVWFGKGDDW